MAEKLIAFKKREQPASHRAQVALAIALALAIGSIWATTATAGERSVTLAVDNMFCAACPIIVKGTLARIDGVRDVKVSFESKMAVIVFDDAVTNLSALSEATASVGYPSKPLP